MTWKLVKMILRWCDWNLPWTFLRWTDVEDKTFRLRRFRWPRTWRGSRRCREGSTSLNHPWSTQNDNDLQKIILLQIEDVIVFWVFWKTLFGEWHKCQILCSRKSSRCCSLLLNLLFSLFNKVQLCHLILFTYLERF